MIIYRRIFVSSAQREFKICVHRVNINECRPETFEDIKQEAVQETLNGHDEEICKNINIKSSCKSNERKYNNTSDHNVIDTSFKEQTFNYSPYVVVISLIMVLVLAFCIVKIVKKLKHKSQADQEFIYYNVEYHA